MAKKSKKQEEGFFNIEEQLKTAVCVPAIRQAVRDWKSQNYPEITDVTRELLNFWFETDHILSNGKKFAFHKAQREAMETLIFISEKEKIRSRKELLEKYAFDLKNIPLPANDDFARFCVKMATGSGKTFVMAMSVVWQFANYQHGGEGYANTFLVLAPNVIVYDRLKTDFGDGAIFRSGLPFMPRHLEWLFKPEMQFYLRGEPERAHSEGALYLTNIQQLYERPNKKSNDENDIMTAMLGQLPPSEKAEIADLEARIAAREGFLMVLNDEAHHTHDEQNEWNKIIRDLHLKRPLAAQLDFSATPRFGKGSLFPWIVSDYPLKQAILDGIVKRPVKGIAKIEEAKSDDAAVRYGGFLVAGVERWKEYREQLMPLKKKPVLFIMMTNTKEADEVAYWLQTTYPSLFGEGKTLTIHTNQSGEVSQKDLETARQAARDVDDDSSEVYAIVSVLMLREGWDVRNVTVIVGLRPYSSKANILPEQTIGRGLRLMFRDMAGDYTERVDIIGNRAFIEFVEDLEKAEDLKFDKFEVGKDRLKIITVMPLESKLMYDIGIPRISAWLACKKSIAKEIAEIDVMKFNVTTIPLQEGAEIDPKIFEYLGHDILTDEKILFREYFIPNPQTPEEIIGYYARTVCASLKLPAHFADLAPKIREFFERKLFGTEVNLNDPKVMKAMNGKIAKYYIDREFKAALKDKITEEKIPELIVAEDLLSRTAPFPTTKKILEARKTVFNYTPCDNEFEYAFARFLDKAEDIEAFAKLPEQFGFCIQYTDVNANIRNYFPDFIARNAEGENWIIETKGREDTDVVRKDAAAERWCAAASEYTHKIWCYMKVMQNVFEEVRPETFGELKLVANVK